MSRSTEFGVRGNEYYTWFGLLVPKKTPQPIVEKSCTRLLGLTDEVIECLDFSLRCMSPV